MMNLSPMPLNHALILMMPVTSQRSSVPQPAPVSLLADCLFVYEQLRITIPDDNSEYRDIGGEHIVAETYLLLQPHDLKPLEVTKILPPLLCLLLLCPAALCPFLINFILLP